MKYIWSKNPTLAHIRGLADVCFRPRKQSPPMTKKKDVHCLVSLFCSPGDDIFASSAFCCVLLLCESLICPRWLPCLAPFRYFGQAYYSLCLAAWLTAPVGKDLQTIPMRRQTQTGMLERRQIKLKEDALVKFPCLLEILVGVWRICSSCGLGILSIRGND